MSARASGYMKGLVFCPNGERLTPREKLVGMVLADSHQDRAKSFTYPSVETIAEESLSDKRTCQRYLEALERKGVILRLRPKGQGRGCLVFYFFPALDVMPEGWQGTALLDGSIFAQKGGERVAEGCQKDGKTHTAPVVRAREREQQREQEQVLTPQPPQAGECGDDGDQVSETRDQEMQKHAEEKETSAQGVAENAIPEAKRELGSTDEAVGDGDECADRCGDTEADSLDAAQLAHIESLHPGADRRLWEEFYREQNRKASAIAPKREEAQRADALKEKLCDMPAARDWVMRQCGFVRRERRGPRIGGIGPVIEAVLQQELDKEQPLWNTAPKMAESWKKFKRNGEFIDVHWGPVKFFELGIWSDERGWAWNQQKLDSLAGASVGSRN